MMKDIEDFFDEIFIWIPSIVTFFIFLYNVISRGEIIMKDWITVLGAVLAAIIAAGVAIWKENRNSAKIIEKVEARHTLEKAHEYHELTMKEFQFNKERITDVKDGVLQVSSDVKDGISQVSSAVGGVSNAVGIVSTDIKLMSKDLENHVLNLKEVINKQPDLVDALKVFESYTQKLGEVQRDNTKLLQENLELQVKLDKQMETIDKLNHDLKGMQALQKEIQELKKDYLSLKKDDGLKDEKIKLLTKKNEELQKEIKDLEKDDLYHDEISL